MYIIHDHFEKKYSGKMCWILLQETDWLTGYFCITRLYYCHKFEDVYKTLTTVVEAYFLSSNRASNITKLKAKVLSRNSWYKHLGTSIKCSGKLFTNQMQVICVAIRVEVMLNPSEDILVLNICAQETFQCLRLAIPYYCGRYQDWAKQNKIRSLTTSL